MRSKNYLKAIKKKKILTNKKYQMRMKDGKEILQSNKKKKKREKQRKKKSK